MTESNIHVVSGKCSKKCLCLCFIDESRLALLHFQPMASSGIEIHNKVGLISRKETFFRVDKGETTYDKQKHCTKSDVCHVVI